MAHRIWQERFGRGITQTSNDFGVLGIPPDRSAWTRCSRTAELRDVIETMNGNCATG